jgi:hypothetical protein
MLKTLILFISLFSVINAQAMNSDQYESLLRTSFSLEVSRAKGGQITPSKEAYLGFLKALYDQLRLKRWSNYSKTYSVLVKREQINFVDDFIIRNEFDLVVGHRSLDSLTSYLLDK